MTLVTSLLVAAIALAVVIGLIVRPDRRRAAAGLAAGDRRCLARHLPWWPRLDPGARRRLARRIHTIRRDIPMIGGDGFMPDAEQQLLVAAQIALCALGRGAAVRLPDEIVIYAEVADHAGIALPFDMIEDLGELATGATWRAQRLNVSWAALARALAGDARNPLVRALAAARVTSATPDDTPWPAGLAPVLADWRAAGPPAAHDALLGVSRGVAPARYVGVLAEAFFQQGPRLAAERPAEYALMATAMDFDTAPRRPAGHRTPSPGDDPAHR